MAVAALALVTAVSAEGRADCNDPFGKPNEVLDFHVRLKRADWNALLASRGPNVDGQPPDSAGCMYQYPVFPAEFRCGNETAWLKIGLRKKRGEERGVEAPLKPPLKLDFNEDFMGRVPEAKGQRWPAVMGELGFRKLSLNNGQGNKPAGRTLILPILLSEHVALRLLKREVPSSPGTAYAKVTLYFDDKPEGEYHGLYILIEDIDRTAIRRRWVEHAGKLIKATKDNCSPEVVYDDGPPNEASAAFSALLAKNPASFGATWTDEVAKGVDLDSLLRQEAIREILVNGDDTITTSATASREGLNFFAFDPKVGRRQYMPWDVDLTFGQQNEFCAPTNLKCSPTQPLFRFCPDSLSRIGKMTACNAEVQKRYLQIMCQMTNGSMSSAEIVKVWDQADATARPVIPLEKDLIWRGMDPLSTSIDKSYGAEYVRLKGWIPQRIASVRQQIVAKGIACPAGCTAGAKEACNYLACPGERRCENNLWTECRPMAGCPAAMPGPGVDGGTVVPPTPGPDGGARADGGAAMADANRPPGGGGAGGGGGSGPPVGGAGGDGSGGATGGQPPGKMPSGGCECRFARRGGGGGQVVVLLGLVAVGAVVRRRRAARRPPR
jgi:hypothetical protein